MSISKLSVFLFVAFICFSFASDDTRKTPIRIAFYNVENLFDTKDDPKTLDEEFTPKSDKEWTDERYQEKLDHLAEVFAGMDYPDVIGVCEVENKQVLEDLIAKTSMAKHGYQIEHKESPDIRGIDVGLLYKKDAFKTLTVSTTRIDFPTDIVEDYTTRDVLTVEGELCDKRKVAFMVNHWPSRRGGVKESSPKREYVASQVMRKVSELLSADNQVILMGDFNDEPHNPSIEKVLGAGCSAYPPKDAPTVLENCMCPLDRIGAGSYNYRGNWNMIDQFIVSKGLQVENVTVFNEPFMLYQDKKYGPKPSRSYGGPRYFGGYSDHLPIYMDLVAK